MSQPGEIGVGGLPGCWRPSTQEQDETSKTNGGLASCRIREDVHGWGEKLRPREDYWSCQLIDCEGPKVGERVNLRQGS